MRYSNNLSTLRDWLDWQEQLHPQSIDLGLERVQCVWQRLQPQRLIFPIITVGGTNGKGSSVALLATILKAAGYRVGAYTSPHLLCYNERIVIDGVCATDSALCQAFSVINQARADISLTYFEFGTLAALELFVNANLDVAILEVGLGGRLDAVNIVDADAALVTTVDLDHVQWLGFDRNAIAKEKAGIFRAGRPAIIGDVDPPSSLLATAHSLGAQVLQAGKDFHFHSNELNWDWHGPQNSHKGLPLPALLGTNQLHNAAAVLMVLNVLQSKLPVTQAALHHGLQSVHLPARLQILPGPVTWILDVAHNPQAAGNLACELAKMPRLGRTHAIFACLADKDASHILQALAPQIDCWHLPQLIGPRVRPWQEIANELNKLNPNCPQYGYNSAAAATVGAMQNAQNGDKILITGSFLTVAAVLNTGLLPITSQAIT